MTLPNPKWLTAGKQVILKEDFIALEDGILDQATSRMQPPLIWVDAGTVRLEATADCPASTQFNGMPNIMNPASQVDGGLCDRVIRTITSNVSCILASGGLYGTEKASQWYAVYALANNINPVAPDYTFTLKAMPMMRVKSQAGQVISLGTLTTPATGIGYGFTTDELIDAKVYFLTGASRGLMRAITANNNDNSTGGTITYGGTALTVAAGDWFIILPNTNFRWVGSFFNNASSNIVKFRKLGAHLQILEYLTINTDTGGGSVIEDIRLACPLATRVSVTHHYPSGGNAKYIDGHPSVTPAGASYSNVPDGCTDITVEFNLEFCRYYSMGVAAAADYTNGYSYPPGCGF